VTLSKVLGGREVSLQITHSGRVRMAELRQTLRSAKLRDGFGILWDGRHFDVDLRIALLDASERTPVAVAYLDLNAGLKAANDKMGHDAGDVAIQAYFQDVNSALADRGDAYRLGGDEVGVIIPACPREEVIKIIRRACLLLQREHLQFDGKELPAVSIAAGLVVNTTPAVGAEQLRRAAEMSMYKAKEFTKGQSSRPSSWNVSGEDAVQEAESNAV
jgi:diguanylate cyclase (GGDEF)-like protein